MRISDSDYSGSSIYNQNLRSSETILFVDYSQRLGRFFYDINPGLSFLTYRLKGLKSINHINPRLQASAAYMIDRKQQLQFAFALGNTYPRINTINNVEQQIDPIIILKGNPDMDNSILLNPRLSYNLNLNKIALQAGVSYYYQNHAIVSDYYIRGGNLISTFRDDCTYHRPGADVSLTYKPSNTLNINVSGQWNEQFIRGGVEHRNLTSFSGRMIVNYYVGNFPSELCCQHRQKIWLITRYAEKHIGDTNCLPCGITEIGRLKQMPTICFDETILLTNFHHRLTHSHRPIGIVNTTSMRL